MVLEIAMADLCYKEQSINKYKKHTLHSLGVGFAFFVVLFILTKKFSISLCPIKAIFGVSCFGCGMTRGFIAILELDFKSAFEYNVLSVPIFLSIGLFSVILLIDYSFDKNCAFRVEKLLAQKYMYPIYVLILIIATILNNLD